MVSKGLVVGSYRSKLREIAGLGVELTAVAPRSWREEGQHIRFEPGREEGYRLIQAPLAWNGHFHLHFYPTLGRIMAEVRPDLLHMDEEAYNLATFLAVRRARRSHIKSLFFTWQNIGRLYPQPFRAMERYVYRKSDFAIAGSERALEIVRNKGFTGPAEVIPQFGVDTDLFAVGEPREGPFTVAYLGRLVPEKGIADLLAAFSMLEPPARLIVAGDGPMAGYVESSASSWRETGRFEYHPRIPSSEVPALLRRVDVVVLPSRSTGRWREQYGRILVEAMAAGRVVVGSDSGEIPTVIGDAGIAVPEGNHLELGQALRRLEASPELRAKLAKRGRERAVRLFSQSSVAERTVDVYRRVLGGAP